MIGTVADKVMHRSLKPDDVGSMPTGPTDKHWSSSGEDTALVTRGRGFDSHPVLSIFDNLVDNAKRP